MGYPLPGNIAELGPEQVRHVNLFGFFQYGQGFLPVYGFIKQCLGKDHGIDNSSGHGRPSCRQASISLAELSGSSFQLFFIA